jgi:hypothetical protein
MPKQRPIIESGIKAPEVRPSFPRFSDGYVPGAAARGAASQLDQLAKGLSSFNRSVTPVLTDLRKGQIEKEQQEGKTLAAEGAELPEDAGRHLRIGFDTHKGAAMASEANSEALSQAAAIYSEGGTVTLEDWDRMQADALAAVMPEAASDEFRASFFDTADALRLSERSNVARRLDVSAATDDEKARQAILARGYVADLTNADVDMKETMAEINAANEARINPEDPNVEPANARMTTTKTFDTIEAQILANEDVPIDRRMEAIDALGDLQLKEGPARYSTLYAQRLTALRNAVEVQHEDRQSDNKRRTDAEVQATNVTSLGVYLDSQRPEGTPLDTQGWNEMKANARAAGGPEAEAYVVQLQDADKARREKDADFKVDQAWVASFTHDLMAGNMDRKEARLRLQGGLAYLKIDGRTAIFLEGQIEGMPEEGNTASRINEHRTHLKQRHMGADFGPGVKAVEQDQYEVAVRNYDQYLLDSVEYNDPNTPQHRKRQIENEALDATNDIVPSLRSGTHAGDRGKIQIESYPVLTEDVLDRLDREVAELHATGQDWSGADLSRELQQAIVEQGGTPLIGQQDKDIKKLLDSQFRRSQGISGKADTSATNPNSARQ